MRARRCSAPFWRASAGQAGLTETPVFDLTRHFFREFFYLRFLTDTGADSVKRAVIGSVSGLLALSILFPQFVVGRYAKMRGLEEYRRALLSDQLFTICVAMFIVGFVAALVCQSLFPDETDYRVLTPLPVTRRLVFATKLLALILFASIFVLSTNLIFGLAFGAAAAGRWAEYGIVRRTLAHVCATGLASIFAGASVMSVQGLIAALSPRAYLRSVSVVTQTAMISALILSLPVIAHASRYAVLLQTRAALGFAVPPLWFLGLEQVLLGGRDPFLQQLAVAALVGVVGAIVVILACYLAAYRRFDQLVLRTSQMPLRPRLWPAWSRPLSEQHRARRAFARFTTTTIRRSGLHQVVFCSLSAIGVAVAVNSTIGFGSGSTPRAQAAIAWRFAEALFEMPLVFFFFSVAAVRTALLLPLDLRANWVFRLTEDPATKPQLLASVERSLIWLAIVPYVVLTFVVQGVVLGATAAVRAALPTALLGLVLVESVLRRWHRIPFTCTYIPGKRPLAHSMLLTLAAFVVFINIGGGLIHFSLGRPRGYVLLCGALFTGVAVLRRTRLARSLDSPLEFEDSLPDDVTVIPWS
jgi:ABC-type transport system involved in multi-copper enzyme maturation permease subunit